MNTASSIRKQTSFRLSEDLLARLQEEAKRHNRSLNNLVESVLMAFVSERPNKTTLAAMKEAETSENLETLDLKSFRSFVDSL
ncbi:MAG: ribbon-helix-helix protein, CopG family [Muribaculaceae bacterium]|nr:ribbon-helix-helix protein, CopG family [Muribaculaceae bacterium]